MALIHRLPDEILLYIFEIHVSNLDTPQRLLRVCRRWHSITVDSASLWSNLYYASSLRPGQDISTVHTTVTSLIHAVNRTKQYKFSLNISNPLKMVASDEFEYTREEWRTIAAPVSARCRSLSIVNCFAHFCLPFKEMRALERLELENITPQTRNHYLAIAEATSLHLRELKISNWHGVLLQEYPKITSQLFSLSIFMYGPIRTQILFGNALVLENLKLGGLSIDSLVLVESSMPSLRTLLVFNACLEPLQPEKYPNLTNLYLDKVRPQNQSFLYHIPSLLVLTFKGYWNHIDRFHVSRLHTLNLLSLESVPKLNRNALLQSTLRPRTLRIDVGFNAEFKEMHLREILWGPWSDIQELKVVYTWNDCRMRDPLMNAFLGMKHKEPACPNLRKLAILSLITARQTKAGAERRAAAEARLGKIGEKRRVDGVLDSVLYGWYKQVPVAEGDHSVEWVDLSSSATTSIST